MLKLCILHFTVFLSFSALLGCQLASGNREPNNVQFEFDAAKVQLLRWAAQNRIMFQFPDATFADVSVIQTQDSCKTLKEPIWTQAVFTTLESLKKNPSLQNKIHVIEVKRGEMAKVETTKDLDGITYLVLNYSISEKKSMVTDASQLPCESKTTLNLGEEVTDISFVLPSETAITNVVRNLPTREFPERWKFNTEFLKHLADKMTLLRFSADLGFERSSDGQFFLVQFLNEQAKTITKNNFTAFEYWLGEITQRSHSGSYLKIMALVPDKQLGFGMNTALNSKGLAYPFLSYKSQNGKYTYTTMNQLNRCLEELSSRYKRGLASIRSDFSTQAETFLSPGHICHDEKP